MEACRTSRRAVAPCFTRGALGAPLCMRCPPARGACRREVTWLKKPPASFSMSSRTCSASCMEYHSRISAQLMLGIESLAYRYSSIGDDHMHSTVTCTSRFKLHGCDCVDSAGWALTKRSASLFHDQANRCLTRRQPALMTHQADCARYPRLFFVKTYPAEMLLRFVQKSLDATEVRRAEHRTRSRRTVVLRLEHRVPANCLAAFNPVPGQSLPFWPQFSFEYVE